MVHSSSCGERALARFVMDHATWPVVVLDGAGVVVEMNRAARERATELTDFFDSARADDALAIFLSALEAPGVTLDSALAHTLADGRVRHLSLSGANVQGWRVIAVDDVSARRALELELDGLRRAESLGMLTASLVHDLNNLLTPVLCLSGVALRAAEGTGVEAHLRDLEATAQRASSLVRDMLALGRPRAPATSSVDVNAVVSELAPIAERLLGERTALTLQLAPELPTVRLDRARLEHALLNIVANARDAMPHGGRVTITTARSARDTSRVAITVTDDGPGMDEATRERAFERWFTTKASGSGLGLASVRSFVRESEGAVSIESAPGRGTSITMRLPSDEAREDLTTALARSAVVLVIDPDAPVRRAARAALEARGLSVFESDDLEGALGITRAIAVDVVLVDVSFARSDPQLGERLRGAAPRARIVWMTGELEPRLPGRALRKAFSEHELVRAVRDALDHRDA